MAVQMQILETSGSDSPTTFTANGTAICLGGETITVKVVLVPADFNSTPTVQSATVTAVTGAPGLNEWTASFDSTPDLPFGLYALAYDSSTLVGQANEIVTEIIFDDAITRRKRKGKKKVKKVSKKSK